MFSELIFEAVIVDVDRNTGTCSINPISANENATISNVKLPYMAGIGNAGIFMGISEGTRVVAAYTSGRSRESAVIIQLLSKSELFPDIFYNSTSSEIKRETQAYPNIKENEIYITGNHGSEIKIHETGDIISSVAGGAGIYLRNNGIKTSHTLVSESSTEYTNSGRKISGSAYRINSTVRAQSQKEGILELPLFADTFYNQLSEPRGFFSGSPARLQSFGKSLRNPELSENKIIINEFSTDSMFTGFSDEVKRLSGSLKLFENNNFYNRNREPGNSLHMAEHELIEIIGGNLIDINGNLLDINYRTLNYGGSENKVPSTEISLSYDKSRRISRRGVGYHFQLSTNSRKEDPSSYQTNFAFDIDKEGVIKASIPRSSNTGNIPFSSLANYIGNENEVDVSFANGSFSEKIPVILRDENGEILLPSGLNEAGEGRETGIRFSNSRKNPYFPSINSNSISSSVRVNTTRYHNMYAACEKLFGSTIERIYIPEEFVNNFGMGSGNPIGKPFEVLIPLEDQIGESNNSEKETITDISSLLSQPEKLIETIFNQTNNDGYPQYMSTVGVLPSPPAIYPGGDTVVGGLIYEDDVFSPPYSNSFNLEKSGENFESEIVDESGNPAIDAGGRSANLSFLGLVELSIGADNFDKKSLVLDTEGSIVSWIGKDKNQRSIITQTDGGVFLNIGGTYTGQNTEEPQMNIGRFSLRVNITDKGFVDSQYNEEAKEEDENKNPNGNSDVIVDISEAGIVIAGMSTNIPMIIRNSGKILIESASNLTLKGSSVQIVESDGKAKNHKTSKR